MKTFASNRCFRFIWQLTYLFLVTFIGLNTFASGSSTLVIAEVYGAGGNAGATYQNDFVVLFNRSAASVNLTGYSIQYAPATSTAWSVAALTNMTLPAGGYYLIKMNSAGANGLTLPTPDSTNNMTFSATAGKVALVNNTTALSGTNPVSASLVDLVGYGTTANGYEGSAPAAAPGTTTSVQRTNLGCQDTDVNATDFSTATPNPRNSSTTIHSCVVILPPVISGISPANALANAGTNLAFTVALSQGDAPLTYRWYKEIVGVSTNLIAAANTATLSLTNLLKADQANYQVTISNASLTSVTSAVVSLSVMEPVINFQPAAFFGYSNATAIFNVNASGTTLNYQWYQGNPSPAANFALTNNTRITGANSNALAISNLQNSDANNYFVIVSNNFGSVTSSFASLTVAASGVLAGLVLTNTLMNQTLTLNFTISENFTNHDVVGTNLLISANPNLISVNNLILGGSGTNRTLTISPTSNSLGAAPISLTLSNGSSVATTKFTVLVLPNTNVIFNDYFNYADGVLTTNAFNLWNSFEGSNFFNISNHTAIISQNASQNVFVDLLGQPYSTNSSTILYTSFKVNFSTLPSLTGAYFAHFLDKTTANLTTFSNCGARIFASTLNAAPGWFRLGIGNGSGATNASGQWPVDLTTNQTYLVVTRFTLASGFATIWLNPVYETDFSVTATDAPSDWLATNAMNVTSYGLRQNSAAGILALNDLRIGLTFDSVVDNLKITKAGNNAVLVWQNPQFKLQVSSNVASGYTNISGATSPFTTNLNGALMNFFRLVR